MLDAKILAELFESQESLTYNEIFVFLVDLQSKIS